MRSFHGKPNGIRVQFLDANGAIIAEGAKGSGVFSTTANSSLGHTRPVEYQTNYEIDSNINRLFNVGAIEEDAKVSKINVIVSDARGER